MEAPLPFNYVQNSSFRQKVSRALGDIGEVMGGAVNSLALPP